MKKYQDEEIERARQLRIKEGYSFAHLQRLTGIPATTIRNWCSDDFAGNRWETLLRTNERKRQEIKLSELEVVTSVNITSNTAKIFLALIYWCEGYKYPSSNKVGFTNTDPALLRFFIMLLRKSFILDEAKLRVHLQIHTSHDYTKLRGFWSDLLNIPESQFMKPTITKARGGKHKKEYLGTCTIRYADFRILLKLTGIFEQLTRTIDVK